MTFSNVMDILLAILVRIGGVVAVWLLAKIGEFISNKITAASIEIGNSVEKTDLEKFNKLIELVETYVMKVVKELNYTMKKAILDATDDGKLTDDDKEKLKNTALEKVKSIISEVDQIVLSMHIDDLDTYICTLIENFVEEVKPPKKVQKQSKTPKE